MHTDFTEQLLKVTNNNTRVKAAVDYVKKYHEDQRRRSGEPFHNHPIAVAYIVAIIYYDITLIIAALLHDTVEDTLLDIKHIKFVWGEEVAQIVDLVTKFDIDNDIALNSEKTIYKILALGQNNKKALLVKLADRIHNMRTIKSMPINKQKRIASETLQVYVPLARSLELEDIANELETISLQVLDI